MVSRRKTATHTFACTKGSAVLIFIRPRITFALCALFYPFSWSRDAFSGIKVEHYSNSVCHTSADWHTGARASHVLTLREYCFHWIALVQSHTLAVCHSHLGAYKNQKEINFSILCAHTHTSASFYKRTLPNSSYLVLMLFTSLVWNLRCSWFSAAAPAAAVLATTTTIIATNETQPILLHVHSQLLCRSPFAWLAT